MCVLIPIFYWKFPSALLFLGFIYGRISSYGHYLLWTVINSGWDIIDYILGRHSPWWRQTSKPVPVFEPGTPVVMLTATPQQVIVLGETWHSLSIRVFFEKQKYLSVPEELPQKFTPVVKLSCFPFSLTQLKMNRYQILLPCLPFPRSV